MSYWKGAVSLSIEIGTVSDFGVDSQDVQNFYKESWNRPIALSDNDFYNWQFRNAPLHNNLDASVIAYDVKKKLILGVMGVTKRQMILDGKSIVGGEMTTWMISEKLQGTGIGTKIVGHCQSQYEALSGFGISGASRRVFMRQGFRFIRQIPRYIKVINFEPLKKYAKYDSLAQDLIDRWKFGTSSKFSVDDVTERSIEQSNRHLKQNFNHFSRDAAHLKWRYKNHPYFNYKQFMISSDPKNNLVDVFVCLREESSLDGFKMLHVIDCFGADENLPAAVRFIEDYAREIKFDVIDFYCTAPSITCHFVSSGWFSLADDECFQFPHLFHPIEMRDPPTANVVYWSKENFEKLADTSKLYITKQDSDLDRPTPENLHKV